MLRSSLLLLAVVGFASATAPAPRAVSALAKSLMNQWGSNRLNASMAMEVAEKQLQHLLDNRNETRLVTFREPEPMTIDCPALPPRTPASVITDLHPQDIKVVGAIGDSVSTGCNSESSSWLNMKDYEGIAWSMGGDDGAVTMPNILSEYAELIGQAHGTGDGNKGFNHAKNGAVVQDTPGQAAALVEAIKNNPSVDYNNDWKVVTVLIGGNNLCDVCLGDKEKENNAAIYEHHLTQTLTTLSQLPRTFVNLVNHMDYTQIAKYKGFFCGIALSFVCDCLTTTNGDKQHRAQVEIPLFNEVNTRLAPKFRRDDFAVVVQPMLERAIVPDDSYISDADCFHPSGAGQRMFGTALWNAMITPVADKQSFVASAQDSPKCATENTLLYVQ